MRESHGAWSPLHSHRPPPRRAAGVMTATSRLCAEVGGGGIMGPSFCPPEPNLPTFQLLQPCQQREGGGREGRERSEISSAPLNRCRTAGARQNARNATLPFINARHAFAASHGKEEKPPYQNVSLHFGRLDQALFLHFPPSFLPIRHRALQTGGVLDRCCLLCQPATSQPVSPPGSESARKWVGLQPSVDY